MSLSIDEDTSEDVIEISGVYGMESAGSQNVTLTILMEDSQLTQVYDDSGAAPIIEVTIDDCYPKIEWLNGTFPLDLTLMSGSTIIYATNMPSECFTVCPDCAPFIDIAQTDTWITRDETENTTTFNLSSDEPPEVGEYNFPWGVYD